MSYSKLFKKTYQKAACRIISGKWSVKVADMTAYNNDAVDELLSSSCIESLWNRHGNAVLKAILTFRDEIKMV